MPTVDVAAAQVEVLRGQLDTQAKTLRIFDRRVTAMEAKAGDSPPWTGAGGPGALDFLSQMRGSPAFVTDPVIARESTPCLCYEVAARDDGSTELCVKHGLVGPLDQEQISLYCDSKLRLTPTAAQLQRVQDHQDAANVCKVVVKEAPKDDQTGTYLSCMERELRARGRALSGADIVPQDPTPATMPSEAQGYAGGGDTPPPAVPVPEAVYVTSNQALGEQPDVTDTGDTE